ncbi:putative hemolysin [Brevundimonas sp.]|uniref:putative hemolysin n=1 Tax=Brevundimonas sp. TaxID=1871086 RepID=UPI003D6CFC5D
MVRLFVVGAVAALALVAACAPQEALRPTIGMANPASVSCIDKGGRSEIRSTSAGQIGVCRFADGRECEEWTLHRDNRCVRPD